MSVLVSTHLGGHAAQATLDFVNTLDGWTILSGRLRHAAKGGGMRELELLPG
ncbi:MAG: hypothetical protein WAV54_17920 [Acidimicrobiales bacterium]